MRVKLPGSTKLKGVLLGICIIIAGVILISNKFQNELNRDKNIKSQTEDQKEETTIITTESEEKNKKDQKKLETSINTKLDNNYNEAYGEFFKGNYKKTIDISDKILKEDPNYYKAMNIRGIAKAYDGNFESGMNDIDNSLKINPDFGYARFNKALNYELYGKLDEALEWYDKALEVEEYQWSYYGIASIYGRRGDVDNSIKFLKKSIDMDDSIKDIAKEEEDFNPIKESKRFKELTK